MRINMVHIVNPGTHGAAVSSLNDSRMSDATYWLYRIHLVAHGGGVYTVIEVSLVS